MIHQLANLADFLLTVKHILTECANLRDIRAEYFTVLSVRELFESVNNHTFFDFIKENHFIISSIPLVFLFVSDYLILFLSTCLLSFYPFFMALNSL